MNPRYFRPGRMCNDRFLLSTSKESPNLTGSHYFISRWRAFENTHLVGEPTDTIFRNDLRPWRSSAHVVPTDSPRNTNRLRTHFLQWQDMMKIE